MQFILFNFCSYKNRVLEKEYTEIRWRKCQLVLSKITIQLKFVNSNLFVYNMIQSWENLVFKFQEFNTSRHILFIDTASQAELNVFVSIDLVEYHLHLLLRIPNHVFESGWAFVHIYWIRKLKIIIIYAKLHILCPFDLNTSHASC